VTERNDVSDRTEQADRMDLTAASGGPHDPDRAPGSTASGAGEAGGAGREGGEAGKDGYGRARDRGRAGREGDAEGDDVPEGTRKLWRLGRTSWSLLGMLVIATIVGYLFSLVPLVVIPVVLALFPATLLVPVAGWLKRKGAPAGLAAIVSIVLGILLIGAIIGAMVPLVASQAPELAESAAGGLEELENFLEDGPFGLDIGGVDELLDMAQEQLGEVGELAPQAITAATVAFETVAGILLLFVVLFFYLKDGPRLANGVISLAPARHQDRAHRLAARSWDTLGKYFRGQMLVAFVDAVGIGIGLVILGVPLAVPLAVLVFFGGLFPIVGAVVTGALAVLVALADQGLTTALIVAGIVLAVQQLESNVLEPVILGRAIHLHPLVVLIAITTGAVTIGILGAFLAVPVAAVISEIVDELRGGSDEEEDEAGDEEASAPEEAPAAAS
jgi:putative heme transporter